MVLVDVGQLGFQLGHALSQLLRRGLGGGFGVSLRLGFLLREFSFGVLVLLMLVVMRHGDSFIKRAFALPNGAVRPIFKRKDGGGHNYFAAAVRNSVCRSSI